MTPAQRDALATRIVDDVATHFGLTHASGQNADPKETLRDVVRRTLQDFVTDPRIIDMRTPSLARQTWPSRLAGWLYRRGMTRTSWWVADLYFWAKSRKNILALLLLVIPLSAEPIIRFVPAGEPIGPYQRWSVQICAVQAPETVQGWYYLAQADKAGIAVPARVELQREVDRANRLSKPRIAAMVLETTAYLATGLIASGLAKIDEKPISAGLGLAGGALRIITTATAPKDLEIPRELWPGFAIVAPGPCAEYVEFGLKR